MAVNPSAKFSDLFETTKVTKEGKCPKGFAAANTAFDPYKTKVGGKDVYVECLRIKVR